MLNFTTKIPINFILITEQISIPNYFSILPKKIIFYYCNLDYLDHIPLTIFK